MMTGVPEQNGDDLLQPAAEAWQQGNVEEALRLLRAVRAGDPQPTDIGRAAALEYACLDMLDSDSKRDATLQQVLRKHHEQSEVLMALGTQLCDFGHHDRAVDILVQACAMDSESPYPWYNLGLAYQQLEEYEEAVTAYRKAAACEDHHPWIHANLALCLHSIGETEESVASLRRYLELLPEDQAMWITLAVIESERGERDAAQRCFEQAEAIEPELPELHFRWALVAAQEQDRDRAQSSLQMLETAAMHDCRTALVRSVVAEMDGLVWPAWEHLQEAISIAAEGEEPDSHEMCIMAALDFLKRQEMDDQVPEVIEEIFRTHQFSPDVLAALRDLDGEEISGAHLYFVIVKARLTDPDELEYLADSAPEYTEFCYYRSYQVIAQSDEDARRRVSDFEHRVRDGSDITIEELEEIEDVDGPVALGVAACTPAHIFPVLAN